MKLLLAFLLLAIQPVPAAPPDTHWTLEDSTLTYHLSHPFHKTEGVSRAATGNGQCHAGECDFTISVPVNSFDSGNHSRDNHMLQVTRAAQFPTIIVQTHVPEAAATAASFHTDLQIQFAGQTVNYKQVEFQRTAEGNDSVVRGTIPLTLSDFKIDPPSVIGLAVKNEVPLQVEARWRAN